MSRRNSTALITGATGQDGVYLVQLLRAEGVRVVGTHRPGSPAAHAMSPYLGGVTLVPLDLRDHRGFTDLVRDLRPDEVYNLAAFSSVGASWDDPETAMELNARAPAAMLKALELLPATRFLQAGSAEETGPAATSPYALGKAQAREAVVLARDQGRYCVDAVLHMHESPLRRPTFVVRKITRAAVEIALGLRDRLALGRVDIRRDWGAAADHVRAMPLMLRADQAADHVVATGAVHSLRDVVDMAFEAAGVGNPWDRIDINAARARPMDARELVGDPRPIREALGWQAITTLERTIAHMVEVDRRRLQSGVEEDQTYLALSSSGRTAMQ
ncbi:GDP-mannose 4,6-dehydratase [Nocardioides immobilis]|nr:GDP-mannose 4,6-dehydratase [Nocardioides immobilis]